MFGMFKVFFDGKWESDVGFWGSGLPGGVDLPLGCDDAIFSSGFPSERAGDVGLTIFGAFAFAFHHPTQNKRNK